MRFAVYEQQLKWFALFLGILSTIAIINDLYPYTMFIGLPFCLIWVYCAWLHSERQLKWINIIFTGLYSYGIVSYYFWQQPYIALPSFIKIGLPSAVLKGIIFPLYRAHSVGLLCLLLPRLTSSSTKTNSASKTSKTLIFLLFQKACCLNLAILIIHLFEK